MISMEKQKNDIVPLKSEKYFCFIKVFAVITLSMQSFWCRSKIYTKGKVIDKEDYGPLVVFLSITLGIAKSYKEAQ